MDEYEWIRDGLRRPGKSRKGLAKAMGVSDSAITALLGAEKPRSQSNHNKPVKRRQLKAAEIEKIANYLEVEPPAFHKPKTIQLFQVFTKEATLRIYKSDDLDGNSVRLPPGDQGSTAALIVRGAKMSGLVSGDWIIYFGNRKVDNFEEMQGQLCVIGYGDDKVLVGVFEESKYSGLYDFRDFFETELKIAQKIDWVADVKSFIPPNQVSEYLTSGPDMPNRKILKIRNHT